jgi:ABC-2 type transport system permease protein
MRKMLVVAAREYNAAVRTKTFIIGLVAMPLLMGGSILIQWFLEDFRDTKDKKFAVVDRTPNAQLFPLLEASFKVYNQLGTVDKDTGKQVRPHFVVEKEAASANDPAAMAEQRLALSERVRKGELHGFLEIGVDVFELRPESDATKLLATTTSGSSRRFDSMADALELDDRHVVRYQSNRLGNDTFRAVVDRVVNEAIQRHRFADKNVNYPQVKELEQKVYLRGRGLSKRDRTGEIQDTSEASQIAALAVPGVMMMLMFMVMLMGSTPLMQGVVEEKMQRIAEVLLGSVRPFDLMLGKLVGMTAVSLTIATVYLGGAYWAAYHYGFSEFVSVPLLLWFLVYQALAALMFGSLFIAIGAACTDMKETQNLLWPVMLLACLPMFMLGNVIQEPNNAAATGMSFFPFATPMLMIARQAIPPGIPLWQPFAGVAIVLATTVLCVYAAGRIFRVGILMQGKGANYAQMFRWVLRG